MSKKKGRQSDSEMEGVIEITRSGNGYVIVEGRKTDILVRPNDFNKAFDGDKVLVKLKEGNRQRRPEGKVIDVVERKKSEFVGQLQVSEKYAFFIASTDKPMPDFFVSKEHLNGANDKDHVVVQLISWDGKKPEGKVVSRLEARNPVDLAMKEITIQNGFSINFPEEVISAADALDPAIKEEELQRRRDFRQVLTMTIDPEDAKDFDDALSIQRTDAGDYEIGVHIADVSHFVREGNTLDKEAYQRGTSVYLPDRVVPMLPEKISNELCSLRPGEEKYSFSAVFIISPQFKIKESWFGKTVIKSDHRFSYEQVQEIIDSGEGQYKDEVLTLNKIARHFREERFRKGAINFSSSEVKFLLDAEGRPRGIVLKESKEAHQLIEEFMLLANREVASFVSKIKVQKELLPFPYRIHDTPDEEKLKPYVAFARKFGYSFNMKDERAIAQSFNQLLQDVKGKPEQLVLEQLGIRTMAKAEYNPDNIGHYGLGFKFYCHFTSPIRRYPDIMVHRILQDILDQKVHVDNKMTEKCRHCSERERAAMEAERAGNKYEQVLYMSDKVGEDMDGVISGVSSFGFWVETVNEKCEGMVSTKDLAVYDEFRHDEDEYCLVGSRTGRKFRMGDLVRVQLVSANLEKRQLDFEWLPSDEPERSAERKSAKNTDRKSGDKPGRKPERKSGTKKKR